MALQLFLKVKANGSDISGESSQKGFENWIEVQSFSWGVVTARDTSTGLTTGRRQYKEFRWVNRHQKSTPLLWKALTNSEVVEAELDCVRDSPSGDGTSEIFMKLNFKQGRISALDQAGEEADVFEEFGLVFQSASMLHVDGGIEHQDSTTA